MFSYPVRPVRNPELIGALGKVCHPAVDTHEAIARERGDRRPVEPLEGTRPFRQDPQGAGPALAERSLEGPLLAARLEPRAARRAGRRQRALHAAGNAGEAHGGTEIHERSGALRAEIGGASLEHATDVRVDRQDGQPEGESRDRICRIPADAGKIGEIVRPPRCGDTPGRVVEAHGAAVVAESLPLADHVAKWCVRQGARSRPALEPRLVPRNDPRDLGLLEHDLRDQDRVRIIGAPPGKRVPTVLLEPGGERGVHRGGG